MRLSLGPEAIRTFSPPIFVGETPSHYFEADSIRLAQTCTFSSARIYFKEKSDYRGIPTFRFNTREDFVNRIGPEYGTECFCSGNVTNVPSHANGCLLKGAMDLTLCQGDCQARLRGVRDVISLSFPWNRWPHNYDFTTHARSSSRI